jgi:hypothetical protein
MQTDFVRQGMNDNRNVRYKILTDRRMIIKPKMNTLLFLSLPGFTGRRFGGGLKI